MLEAYDAAPTPLSAECAKMMSPRCRFPVCSLVFPVAGRADSTPTASKEHTMPLYVYNLHEDETAYAEGGAADFDAVMKLHQDFAKTVEDSGAKIVLGEALQPSSTASFLRNTCTDKVQAVDNPLPELKEQLGGFYVVDVTDEAQAMELARSAPAPHGFVEVRPVWEFS
jgi:hypothetical protein